VSKRDRLGLTHNLTTRGLWRSRRWTKGNENFVYESLWDFKSSFTCRKNLTTWDGVLRIFIALKSPSPWPGSNPQPLGPVAITLTTTPPRRLNMALHKDELSDLCLLLNLLQYKIRDSTFFFRPVCLVFAKRRWIWRKLCVSSANKLFFLWVKLFGIYKTYRSSPWRQK
jgi:hypothetical protein